jgi:hypothetical protein
MVKKLENPSIAVIGAGVAGSVCAYFLKKNGFNPIVIEKSRRVGGRLANRNINSVYQFDHGVQFFTIRTEGFKTLLDKSISAGTVSTWNPALTEDQSEINGVWMVGEPNMNSFLKNILIEVQVNLEDEVSSVFRECGKWNVRTQSDNKGKLFQNVISTVPAPQVRDLLSLEKDLMKKINEVEVAPCWTLMLAFEHYLEIGFDAWRSDDEGIAWLARNSSKPSRDKSSDCWVVQASATWSRNNLEKDNDHIVNMLMKELQRLFGNRFLNPDFKMAHRWRYARTIKPLGKPYLCSSDKTLFAGGDWCLGARVEHAYESGYAIAKAFIKNYNE